MSERYVCIHGHFYQPPRENPWTEEVGREESAAPYHDWNERITAECYAPNAHSRLLAGGVERQVNNYASLSFNVGPTLLRWLERHAPDVYRAMLAADHDSAGRFDGHGSAMAQVYNHIIMPLADRRDKVTQVVWGKRDFAFRFGREAEGMWLPETAVDTECLEVLAEQGIRFTILAPHQAARVRRLGSDTWHEVGGALDTTMPYQVRLPSGRAIAVFFYHGAVARAVAFEGLLDSGERFADRLIGIFDGAADKPALAHIATDGESYGHHHRHGDMALAHAVHHLEGLGGVRVTNYAAYLARHPPTHEAMIVENTSWSCPHGIERWRSDCGCSAGGHPAWQQAWRRPLREALDHLRDQLREVYHQCTDGLLHDAEAARQVYIDVVLESGQIESFLAAHTSAGSEDERRRVGQALEMQRQAMLMFTSCGWFFDELSRLEGTQVLRYAGRALELAAALGATTVQQGFLDRLAWARSNLPEMGDGSHIYARAIEADGRYIAARG